MILSVGWYLVNRGSKYWQENWEKHVDVLEDETIGPLYKTTIAKEEFNFSRFWSGYPFSVSKINQIISLFIVLVWLGLVIHSFPTMNWSLSWVSAGYLVLIGLTFIFLVLLFSLGRTSFEARRINFRKRKPEDTKETEQAP